MPTTAVLSAVDEMSTMLAYWNREQRCLYANAAYAAWFGRTPATMVGVTLEELFGHVDDRLLYFRAALAGTPQQFERVVVRTDGSLRHALANITPDVRDGVVVGMTATITDVTSLREGQFALERNTRLLEYTGALATVGGIELDLRTGAFFWTAEMCRILDVDPSNIPPVERWTEFYSPEALPQYLAGRAALLTSRTPVEYETPMITATGRHIWMRIRSAAIREDDEVVRVFSAHQDITERKATEASLQINAERLQAALNATQDAIWDLDIATNDVYLPTTWYTMLGYAPRSGARPLGEIGDYVHPDDRAGVRTALALAIGEGTPYIVEARMRSSSGAWQWIQCRGRVTARDAAGKATRFSGTNTDIHARRVAEEQRKATELQLQHAQKLESVGRLAGGIAHDFNNMLLVILGYAEQAMESLAPDDPVRDDIAGITGAAQRSAALTKQLLTFARKQIVAPQLLELNPSVARTLPMLQRLLGEGVDIEWRPGDALWPVLLDPSQFDQILFNLAVNARDAMPGTGTLCFTSSSAVIHSSTERPPGASPGEYVRLSVRDTGFGMDDHTMSRIFEPFFTTKEVGRGTGLGLSTVFGIMQQHGGFVAAESTVGVGTTFHLYFPRHHGGTEAEPATAIPDAALGGTETILLVEDDPSILALTARNLGKYGYRVLPAATIAEALQLAEEHAGHVQLLVTDVVMPKMGGRDLAALLQQRHPSLRVIFMSGYAADAMELEDLWGQGADLVQKPFSTNALAARVRAALNRP